MYCLNDFANIQKINYMKKGQKNRFSKPVFNGGCGLDTGFMGFIESGLNRDKAIEIGKKNKKSKRKKR